MQAKGQGKVGGGGRSRFGGKGSSPRGYCVCPSCGVKTPYMAGFLCSQMECPKCNMKMM